MLKIRWYGTPLPQSRPRFFNGHAYEEPRMKKYKRDLRHSVYAMIPKYRLEELPFTEISSVKIIIYRNCRACSKRFGDIDNHAKAILDALRGFIWLDDAIITELSLKKVESKDEGIEIIVN